MGTIEREPEVIDNLTSTSTIDALSANQGKVLNEKIMAGQVRCYNLWKTVTSGYFTVPYTEVPRGYPFISTEYRSGAGNLGLIYSLSMDYQNGYVVYVRNHDGTLPSDGTSVAFYMLVFLV